MASMSIIHKGIEGGIEEVDHQFSSTWYMCDRFTINLTIIILKMIMNTKN